MKPPKLSLLACLLVLIGTLCVGCDEGDPNASTKAQKHAVDDWLSSPPGTSLIKSVRDEFPTASSCTINTVRREGKVQLYIRVLQDEPLTKESVQKMVKLVETAKVPHADGIRLDVGERVFSAQEYIDSH